MDKQLYLIDNFCNYKIKQNLLLLNDDIKNIFLESANKSLKINFNNPKIIELCIIIINVLDNGPLVKTKFKFISAISNSCYMDTVLFSLLSPNIDYINKKILIEPPKDKFCDSARKIQLELRNIKNYLYGINKNQNFTCRNLRTILSNCKDLSDFSTNNMNDSTEFISKLFGIFNTSNLISENTTYVSNDEINWLIIDSLKNDKESVIRVINLNDIKESKYLLFIDDYINYFTYKTLDNDNLYNSIKYNKQFKYVKTHTKILSSDILIYNIIRKSTINNKFINYPIYPNQTLTIYNKENNSITRYYLCSCVLYTGNLHYISYVKDGNYWYIYNDLNPVIQYIGTFDEMLKLEKSPITNGVIFIYNKFS